MNDNDNLRKLLSRFNGLKKYTSVGKAVNTDVSSVKSPLPVLRPDQNDLSPQKLNNFRDKMVDIVKAMVGVGVTSNVTLRAQIPFVLPRTDRITPRRRENHEEAVQ